MNDKVFIHSSVMKVYHKPGYYATATFEQAVERAKSNGHPIAIMEYPYIGSTATGWHRVHLSEVEHFQKQGFVLRAKLLLQVVMEK